MLLLFIQLFLNTKNISIIFMNHIEYWVSDIIYSIFLINPSFPLFFQPNYDFSS